MGTDIVTAQENKVIIGRILGLSNDIFNAIRLTIPPEWLTSDMTVAQLRILMLIHAEGATRMSSIAGTLKTSLPTITGTVDILVKKGLVSRSSDPDDRRLVFCSLSPAGKEVMGKMWTFGRQQIENLMLGCSTEELKKALEVAEMLLRNVRVNKARD